MNKIITVTAKWIGLRSNFEQDSKSQAFYDEIDAKRLKIVQEMNDFLREFLSKNFELEKFQVTFDKNTRTVWGTFGLKGMSGAMFLNKLNKHLSDSSQTGLELREVLAIPKDRDSALSKMKKFEQYLEKVIGDGKARRIQIQPGRFPFFVSSWWHVQSQELWPIYYKSGRNTLRDKGSLVSVGEPIEDYFNFYDMFNALMSELKMTSWQLEHFLEWCDKSKYIDPQEEKLEVGDDEIVEITEYNDHEEMNHTRIQWLLAKMGKKFGCDIWIARNDHNKEWEGKKLGDMSLRELPSIGLDKDAINIINLIDVLWIKNKRNVVAAFEVEFTTSIYSGLLRMSDLVSLSPNINFPLYIVVPADRVQKVRRELSRATFQINLELHKICSYLIGEELLAESESMLKWANDPKAIDNLAKRVGDKY